MGGWKHEEGGKETWLRAGGIEGFWAISLRTNTVNRHTNPSRLVEPSVV